MVYNCTSDCFACPLKNLDLAQIEEIVAEIEREKEAGEFLIYLFNSIRIVDIDDLCRGGEETLEASSYCCWPGGHGITISGGAIWTVAQTCCIYLVSINSILFAMHSFSVMH
jgi:hypothetical protein